MAVFDPHKSPTRRLEAGGFEQAPLGVPKTPISETPSAESGAREGETTSKDPDLALIVERWPKLPEHIKAAIRTLVQAYADSNKQGRQA